jgi:ABC-2 type transport system ATP-binding protein
VSTARPADGAAIRVDGLTRSFGRASTSVPVLDGVSLEVGYGEVVALLGVNGAGKTTLIKVLSTLLLPTSGSAFVAGYDVVREARRVRAATSVVFGGDRGLYARLTGRENLRFFGMLAGLGRRELAGRVDGALEQVNLGAVADRRVETYSRGMRQRLHLAVGLVASPKVMLLDEPTIGLDPVESDRLRAAILHLRDSGVAILLTSHYLLDVEKLATRVLLLSDGRIQENLTLAEFLRESGHTATVTIRGRGPAPDVAADRLPPTVTARCTRAESGTWVVDLHLREWSGDVFRLLGDLLVAVAVDDVQVRETRLEEAFTAISAQLARR